MENLVNPVKFITILALIYNIILVIVMLLTPILQNNIEKSQKDLITVLSIFSSITCLILIFYLIR